MKSKASKAAGAYNLLSFIDRLATSYTLQRQDQYDQLLPYSWALMNDGMYDSQIPAASGRPLQFIWPIRPSLWPIYSL